MTQKQIWVVSLTYFFEGETDSETHLFATEEKAKEYFDKIVEKEKTQTWIADTDNVDIQQDEHYFYAFDNDEYYETIIQMKLQGVK